MSKPGKKIYFSAKNAFLKHIALPLVDGLYAHKTRKSPAAAKTVAIFKPDVIGDYVLFRNLLPYLKSAEQFKGYRVLLIGNTAWKSLAENLDKKHYDESFYFSKLKFNRNPIYRTGILSQIKKLKVDVLIEPVYQRDADTDIIVKAIGAAKSIGMVSGLGNMSDEERRKSDSYFTDLVDTSSRPLFEFYRNRLFVSSFNQAANEVIMPYIEPERLKQDIPYDNFVVLFPGASSPEKLWSLNRFAEVVKFMLREYPNLKIIICGAPNEQKFAEYIEQGARDTRLINLTGKTTLLELWGILAKAELLISNDTGAVHMAAACKVKTLVLHNGIYNGVFVPWPDNIAPFMIVLQPTALENKGSYSMGDIQAISTEKVINSIKRILPK